MALSYWEQQSFVEYDYIILGSGLVGLCAAIGLREAEPLGRVLLLERGVLPQGASTRNAGFACFGSLTELLFDLAHGGPDAMLALVERRWRGLQRLRERVGDAGLRLEPTGGTELLFSDNIQAWERAGEMNALLSKWFGPQPVFTDATHRLPEWGFAPNLVKGLAHNRLEGVIDTGNMMRTLLGKAQAAGVERITGYAATHLEPTAGGGTEVASATQPEYRFRARRVGICTNAFARPFLPDALELKPGRGLVLVTEPLPHGVPFRGAFHFREGYYYFRHLPGNRILFGGGRNLDVDGEASVEFGENARIRAELENTLKTLIVPRQPVEVAMAWSGIMAFGPERAPIVQHLRPGVACAVRCGGMGVALGAQMADELVALLREP